MPIKRLKRPDVIAGITACIEQDRFPSMNDMRAWADQIERIRSAYLMKLQVENVCRVTGKDCNSRPPTPCACVTEMNKEWSELL